MSNSLQNYNKYLKYARILCKKTNSFDVFVEKPCYLHMEKPIDFWLRKGKAVGETKPTERGERKFEVGLLAMSVSSTLRKYLFTFF